MNLEEAKANNIGAEVELDESTKPYTFMHDDGNEYERSGKTDDSKYYEIIDIDNLGNAILKIDGYQISPRHLKLKPQNYKSHVTTEKESREAQELFFELGAVLGNGDKHAVLVPNIIGLAVIDGLINFVFNDIVMKDINARHITLQELRDMVAKKKLESKCFDEAVGSNPLLKVKVECKEMTWQDAFQALIDGKEVEMLDIYNDWENINDYSVDTIKNGEAFRLAPQRITLNGEYTKEELMQKIGEME